MKKPAAKPPAAKAEDSVALGEKYLYGRGVPQSCEKGLHYVKPAADQSNPKAMITMGALYATGHCLSRDLPTAYRYFALALRQDPANSALKQNTEMVWGQMTQSERQLAIRLTQ
jgi:TPR repeat protein